MMILPALKVPDGILMLVLEFGFSSAASDFDNPVKPFVDCLQKRYGFNDKMIKRCIIDINSTKKGQEYIKFEIRELDEQTKTELLKERVNK